MTETNDQTGASVEIVQADLSLAKHRRDVLFLVDAYSMDAMGDGRPLSDVVRERLIAGLQQHPTTLIYTAYLGGEPVGIAVCFLGFSTFAARTLINVHDLAVLPGHRGRGIGQALLAAVERKGRETGCCKLTLEVQENNQRARRAYEAAGFKQAYADTDAGGSIFMSKYLMSKE